jgi:cytidyltransferase-like protein
MIIVYSYYVLDIVHKGHLEMLRNAKSMAGKDGKLIVGILTEKACCERKPPPLMPFEERVELARSIKYVGLVVAQKTYSPLENILEIKPDILMESTSHAPEPEVEEAMRRLGGRIVRIPYFPDHSSTQIKEEIANA